MPSVKDDTASGKAQALLPWTYRLARRLLVGDRGVLSGLDADEQRAVLHCAVECIVERDRAHRSLGRAA